MHDRHNYRFASSATFGSTGQEKPPFSPAWLTPSWTGWTGLIAYPHRSFFIRHSSHTSFARRVLLFDVHSSYTSVRHSLVVYIRSSFARHTLPLVVRCRTDNIRSWTSWPWTAMPCGYFYGYTLHTLHELIAHGLKDWWSEFFNYPPPFFSGAFQPLLFYITQDLVFNCLPQNALNSSM